MTNEELILDIKAEMVSRFNRLDDRLLGISRSLEVATTNLSAHEDQEGARKIHHTPPCGWATDHETAHDRATEAHHKGRTWLLALAGLAVTVVSAAVGVLGAVVALVRLTP